MVVEPEGFLLKESSGFSKNLPTDIGVPREVGEISMGVDRMKILKKKLEVSKIERIIAQEENAKFNEEHSIKMANFNEEHAKTMALLDIKSKEQSLRFEHKSNEQALRLQANKDSREADWKVFEERHWNESRMASEARSIKFNEDMKEMFNNTNNRPYKMTINPELLMGDEMEVVGTRANPSFLVSDFKPAFFRLLESQETSEVKMRIRQAWDKTMDSLTVDTQVFVSGSDSFNAKTISMSDAIVLMTEYVGHSSGGSRYLRI
jgi:hypothetical protein